MSRTKNRGFQQSFSPSYTIRRWRLGEYIRLSKEDLKKGKDDSNSVKNQRDLLNDFYQKHLEEFESVSEYVDDGHTGTDANRENFQRLLADVMSGKINCVVVKDLSRFARNYSDAGSLIDNLFVQMGVRFISLAENVDSFVNPDSVSSIIVPITNVMNDQYCYQTSKKIRQVFDYKRRNGQYIGSFAPYGYACSVVTSPERTGTEWKGNEARKRATISQNGEIHCKKPSVTGSAGRSMKYIHPAAVQNRSMTKWCGSFARKPLPHLLTKRINRSIIRTATCLSGVHYRRNEP